MAPLKEPLSVEEPVKKGEGPDLLFRKVADKIRGLNPVAPKDVVRPRAHSNNATQQGRQALANAFQQFLACKRYPPPGIP